MKFYCDSCNAKYLINDEKVAGKILKIKCKKCQHIIIVREPAELAASRATGSSPQALRPPSEGVEWFYAISGQTYGPHSLDELEGRFSTGQLGDEAYVWNHTMAGWIPATDAPEFRQHFVRGVVRKPAKPTMTISAVDVQSVVRPLLRGKTQDSLASSASTRPTSSTSNILRRASSAHSRAAGNPILSRAGTRPPLGAPGPGESRVGGQVKGPLPDRPGESTRQQSVSVLRDRLKQIRKHSSGPDTKAAPSSPSLKARVQELKGRADRTGPATVVHDIPPEVLEPEPGDATEQMSIEQLSSGGPLAEPQSIDDTRQVSVAEAIGLAAQTVRPDATEGKAPPPAVETSGRGDDEVHGEPLEAAASGTDAIVDEYEKLPSLDSIERRASTVDPLPKIDRSTPKIALGAGTADLSGLPGSAPGIVSEESGAMSRSLLIQLDTIKRQNRGVRLIAVVGFAVVLLLGASAAAVAHFFLNGDRFAAIKEKDAIARAELEANHGNDTDLTKLKGYKTGELAELIELPESTEPEDVLTFDEDSVPLVREAKRAPRKGSAKVSPKAESPGPTIRETPPPKAPPTTNDKPKTGMSLYESMSASRSKYKVEKAERKVGDNGAPSLPDTLKRDDLVRGFRNVRRSADQCLERHLKRQGRLPKGKVKVVVTINGDGRVSGLNMDREISNTLFDSCMRAHKSRWRFPPFSGKPLLVSRVFVLQ